MNHKRYETMRKNAHDLYRQGDLPQKLAVSIMGYRPSKRWIITKLHTMVAWCLEQIVEAKKNEI